MSKGKTIVIDCGSFSTKAGYSGQDTPNIVFETCIGRSRSWNRPDPLGRIRNLKSTYVGDEAQAKRGILSIKYPMEHGVIEESAGDSFYLYAWDWMTHIWRYIYDDQLQTASSDDPLLLTENIRNPDSTKERMTRTMMEEFNVPKLAIVNTALLSLFGAGKTTGTVVECGHTMTQIVGINEGKCLDENTETIKIGGRHVTDDLMNMLNKSKENEYSFWSGKDREYARDMKQKYLFIAMDYEKEKGATKEIEYKLPDGEIIKISGDMRRMCAQKMFHDEGIHKLLNECIMRSDANLQSKLFENIVLCGGNSMFPGFEQRFQKEMDLMVNKDVLVDGYIRNYDEEYNENMVKMIKRFTSPKPNIIALPQRKYLPWIGGSILCETEQFDQMCMTADEYNESGSSLIHRKFGGNLYAAK